MKTFEIRATEYNGEQEYGIAKLVKADTFEEATQKARTFFSGWYSCQEDGESKTDDVDVFSFDCGCLIVSIQSVREINLEAWIAQQIELHTI